jgi:acetoin:2,6-dichlorophenolindophenol oxidoreductase subunit beta
VAKLSFTQALRAALAEEMRRDPAVFLMGEDVSWNILGSTGGLAEEFGLERVRDTPIAEAGYGGAGIGAALVGMRPVIDFLMAPFMYVAMDQLVSIAAKSTYLYGGQARVPIVFKAAMIYGNSNAAQHSDRPYSMFMNIPGLKIAVPASPADAYGLLKTAIRDDDPVLFFEDAALWMDQEEVPAGGDFTIPFGQARTRREGYDVTIVTIGGAIRNSLTAAEHLAADGISAEVIDPRTLVPLDVDAIYASVRKTGRLVVVDPANQACSAASEIAALAGTACFDDLRAPIQRVTVPNTHVPFSAPVEAPLYPTVERIVAAAKLVTSWQSREPSAVS